MTRASKSQFHQCVLTSGQLTDLGKSVFIVVLMWIAQNSRFHQRKRGIYPIYISCFMFFIDVVVCLLD